MFLFFKNWLRQIKLKRLTSELALMQSWQAEMLRVRRSFGQTVPAWQAEFYVEEIRRLESAIKSFQLPRLDKVLLPSVITRVK